MTDTSPAPLTERSIIDIYCRISRDYDGTLRSVEAQEEACRAAIAEHAHEGWEVGRVFRDHALSAWNPKVHRPEFDELMRRLETREAHGVMVRNLDRFTRKMAEGERLLKVAKQGSVVAALDGHYDLTTARGLKNFREDMVDASYESDRLSERTTRGKRDKARRGKSNASHRGFAMPGYLPNPEGWDAGDPRIPVPAELLEAEQDAVRELARRVLAGESWASMVRWINSTGLKTTYGNDWSATSVRNMLRRPSLAGIITHHGEEAGVLPGEPVLDRETWERVVSVMAAKKRGRQPSGRYLLTNLLTCGHPDCGHLLTGRPRVNMKPYEDGSPRREYWCQRQPGPGSGCGRLAIDQRFADEVVEEAVKAKLGDRRHVDRLARRAAKVKAERNKLQQEIDRLDQWANDLASKTRSWGPERVDKALAPILRDMEALTQKKKALGEPEDPKEAAAGAAADWDRAEKAGDFDALRALVRRAFPDGIMVLPTEKRGRLARDRSRFDWDPKKREQSAR